MIAAHPRQLLVHAQREVDVPEANLTVDQLHRVRDDLTKVCGAFDARPTRRLASREVEKIADRVVNALGLALDSPDELTLLRRFEIAHLHEIEQAPNRGERVSDLVGHPGGEPTDGGQSRAPNELLLCRGQLRGGSLELLEPLLQRDTVLSKLRCHVIEARRETRDLCRALHRNLRLEPSRREPLGGQAQVVDRTNEEIGEQDIGEQQDRRDGQPEIEKKEAPAGGIACPAARRPDANLHPCIRRDGCIRRAVDHAPRSRVAFWRMDLDAGDEAIFDHRRERHAVEALPPCVDARSQRPGERGCPHLLGFGVLVLVEARGH